MPVHFEVVPSMDTSGCVLGIDRFFACQGIPSVIWSDNGTKFVATEKEILQNVLNWNQQAIAESWSRKVSTGSSILLAVSAKG